MMKSSWSRILAVLSLLALSAPAMAADALPQGYLPIGEVAHKLIDKGYDLRGLEMTHGYYMALVHIDGDMLRTLGVNPRTAEPLPPAFMGGKDIPEEFRPKVTAAEVLSIAAAHDIKDLAALSLDDDVWVVEARNGGILRIDAMTGQPVSDKQ
ncbi:MAG TPA: hypothetical protein VK558_16570 [Patescibacteria group bacterium]|nr:hypothetical protein [Patescibacteria group bacterium]